MLVAASHIFFIVYAYHSYGLLIWCYLIYQNHVSNRLFTHTCVHIRHMICVVDYSIWVCYICSNKVAQCHRSFWVPTCSKILLPVIFILHRFIEYKLLLFSWGVFAIFALLSSLGLLFLHIYVFCFLISMCIFFAIVIFKFILLQSFLIS